MRKITQNALCMNLTIFCNILFVTVYCDCQNGQNIFRPRYVLRSEIDNDLSKLMGFSDVMHSCTFGKLHDIFDDKICFDHCTVRHDCAAVKVSDEGCQFCLDSEIDLFRNLQEDFSRIYVNEDAISGKSNFDFMSFKMTLIVNHKLI